MGYTIEIVAAQRACAGLVFYPTNSNEPAVIRQRKNIQAITLAA
jgi:hypothetical protein